MLFVSSSGLENAKRLVAGYKQGQIPLMTPELWQAKKVVDSTLHPGLLLLLFLFCLIEIVPMGVLVFVSGLLFFFVQIDTGEPVFLPFRMSCFVLSNLVVTAGMLTPGLKVWNLPWPFLNVG